VQGFAAKVPLPQKSFWTHLMELLGNLSPMESRFGPFGDSANLDAGLVHSLRETSKGLKIILDTLEGTPT
jgi:hypothetical protein